MREIIKAHGPIWVARKAAELGYQLPSTISREEVPAFNFWLETYLNSPFERYIYALSQSDEMGFGKSIPPEHQKQFADEMSQRKWFEEHLKDFQREFDSAVDYIADYLMERKNIKRCLKSLPAYCYENLAELKMEDFKAEDDSPDEDVSRLLYLKHMIFRGEWDGMKKLEDEGYIILQGDDVDEEMVSDLRVAFQNFADDEPYEFNVDEGTKGYFSFESFLYLVHAKMIVSADFLDAVKSILTERESARLRDQQLVRDVLEIVNLFYIVLPLREILGIVRATQKRWGIPESDQMDQETLIRYIKRLKDSRVVEIEGVMYGVSSSEYDDHLQFQKEYGQMTLQEYRTAIEGDNDLYDTIYEYLSVERIDDEDEEKIRPEIWRQEAYMSFPKIGCLAFGGAYRQLFALMAVILLEERSMNGMFANMFNRLAPDEDDPFHREIESAEVSLQRAYDIVSEMGDAMCKMNSLAVLMDMLQDEIDIGGMKQEVREQLMELLRQCYRETPNSDFRGAAPGEKSSLIEDYELEDPAGEDDE